MSRDSDSERKTTRRTFLKGLGGATFAGVALGPSAKAFPGKGKGKGKGGGWPPKGLTEYGDSIQIGNGDITTFSTVLPTGEPKYVGIHLEEGALEGLPYAEEFEAGKVKGGRKIHGFWSKPFNLDFPENTPDPIKYAGCGWNPQGHTPHGVYDKPHFDFHFHFYEPSKVGKIGPGVIKDLPEEKTPTGYRLIEGGAIIPKMGAHLAPKDAPEFDDPNDSSVWEETMIWGAADVDKDGEYENNYVEPMVTVDYFKNHLSGVEKKEIAQPDVYPKAGYYPMAYAYRDLGDGGHALYVTDFEYKGDDSGHGKGRGKGRGRGRGRGLGLGLFD